MININDNDNVKELKYDYLFSNKSDRVIQMLYKYIMDADKFTSDKVGKILNYTINKINTISQIPRPTMYDSYFFPNEIKTYIHENATYSLQFTFTIKKRAINIYFIVFEHVTQECINMLNQHVYMIYMWLHILDSFSLKKCSKTLELYIYFTPFEKKLPDNQLIVLGSEHVNTAYTTGCKANTEIVLYRKEEWFKVFIHETFHNFGLDFSDMNLNLVNNHLKEIFNVGIEFNLYESYCETWARIMNTMIYSYLNLDTKHKSHYETFKTSFIYNMERECYHSLYQSLKILNFMDLNFKRIVHKTADNIGICKLLYKEDTSVFSYYIITSLLINNFLDFLDWCYKNNNILLQFKKTPGNLDKYIEFIKKSCNNSNIKTNINLLEKKLSKQTDINPTLRMTSTQFT